MSDVTCSIDGCESLIKVRIWCTKHYTLWYRYGDPLGGPAKHPISIWYLNTLSVLPSNECWPWPGHIDKNGYGTATLDGRDQRAHRVSYETFVGPIPDGLQLDHTCHTEDLSCPGGITCPHRRCVNPSHLEPVTHNENIRRGRPKRARSVCRNGHPYDESAPRRGKWHVCIICKTNREQNRMIPSGHVCKNQRESSHLVVQLPQGPSP